MADTSTSPATTLQSSVHFFPGSSITWDGTAGAGYAEISPPHDGPVIATREVAPGLHVDVDATGAIRGIEVLGHEVGLGDLLAVLRHCRFVPLEDASCERCNGRGVLTRSGQDSATGEDCDEDWPCDRCHPAQPGS